MPRIRVAPWVRGRDCECDISCVDHSSGGQCHLNGTPHTHPDDGHGNYGPCPVHRDAPGAPTATA
jgi:hypothetical protein